MSDMDSDFIPAEPGFRIIPNFIEAGLPLESALVLPIVGWNVTTCAHDENGSRIVKGVYPVVAFGNYRFVNGKQVSSWAVQYPDGTFLAQGDGVDMKHCETWEQLVKHWAEQDNG